MLSDACCTCAALLYSTPSKSEKPVIPSQYLSCCGRAICTQCIASNPRFSKYCTYCQISSEPSSLPQGLRDPPAYSPPPSPTPVVAAEPSASAQGEVNEDLPPAYSEAQRAARPNDVQAGGGKPAPDVLHFLHPNDSLQSLSLRYGVPLPVLRSRNAIFSDGLLPARRTLLIPGEFYKGGVSLSPRPLEGEEEEARKAKIRRFMVACKVAEYDVAMLYLEQNGYHLDAAVEAYQEDERWEKEHPLEGTESGGSKKPQPRRTVKKVGMRRFVGNSAARSG